MVMIRSANLYFYGDFQKLPILSAAAPNQCQKGQVTGL